MPSNETAETRWPMAAPAFPPREQEGRAPTRTIREHPSAWPATLGTGLPRWSQALRSSRPLSLVGRPWGAIMDKSNLLVRIGGIALLAVAGLTANAQAQNLKPWRHGVINLKSDAGF